MTNQEKKAYLSKYTDTLAEIERLQEEVREWGERAEGIRSAMNGTGGGSGEDPMQHCIDQMVELQNRLVSKIDESIALRDSIERAIESVADSKLRLLLYYYYIDDMTWNKVAAKMGYDERWTKRLHQRALSKLALASHPKSQI